VTTAMATEGTLHDVERDEVEGNGCGKRKAHRRVRALDGRLVDAFLSAGKLCATIRLVCCQKALAWERGYQARPYKLE